MQVCTARCVCVCVCVHELSFTGLTQPNIWLFFYRLCINGDIAVNINVSPEDPPPSFPECKWRTLLCYDPAVKDPNDKGL